MKHIMCQVLNYNSCWCNNTIKVCKTVKAMIFPEPASKDTPSDLLLMKTLVLSEAQEHWRHQMRGPVMSSDAQHAQYTVTR